MVRPDGFESSSMAAIVGLDRRWNKKFLAHQGPRKKKTSAKVLCQCQKNGRDARPENRAMLVEVRIPDS